MASYFSVEGKLVIKTGEATFLSQLLQSLGSTLLSSVLLWGGMPTIVRSELAPTPAPNQVLALFQTPLGAPVFTAERPSQQGLTVPSLWLAVEQFGGKTVRTWRAYPPNEAGERQIRVVVRPELWTRYNYFERYAFLSKLSTAASRYGYSLLLVDRQNFLLGGFACNFAQIQPQYLSQGRDFQGDPIPNYLGVFLQPEQKPDCELWIRPSLRRGAF
ncbi:hypothetical protein GS597_19105 [Synechococcales cyanobacterium C]|uniref:Uncharacterized protein n=1 Tax=Petrachloros mirabilis ULC683 TaxID=2781853 RepID=A0A8K2A2C4_9CYAN|nr:hypothetical protein [Petrachloros mirabilis]NCJ08578.1 hypothetical protein [Petrachloros mirabilis ULC683]